MFTNLRRINIYFFALLLILTVFSGVTATASDVSPVYTPGNPTCGDLGYDFGFKPQPEPPPSGIYTSPDGWLTVDILSDGTYFDWSSSVGVDAVIVKGGPNANVYSYDPESFGDTGLHSPVNPNNGNPYAISHIEFCYDFELDVTKTAETEFTRTFDWTIAKSVTRETWNLFVGDKAASRYTVTLTKSFTDSDWAVNGMITIANNTPFDATITGVSDWLTGFGDVAVDCGVDLPYVLPDGESLICPYGTALPNGDTRVNTATVTTTGIVHGGVDDASVVFGDPTSIEGYETVNVSDTNGGLWTFADTGAVAYDHLFTCGTDAGTHTNTATILETGQSASASVTVNCYDLTVDKEAFTSLERAWAWTIDKTADQTELTLSLGQQFLVNYDVVVDATAVDSAWAVTGNITVTNTNPHRAAELLSVTDIVSPDIAASVDCGVAWPYPLSYGSPLTCTYSAPLPDGTTRTNTATATLQNYLFASDGASAVNGTTDFTGQATVDFANATVTEETDECITVNDTLKGYLAMACAHETPLKMSYSMWVGPYDTCGYYTVENVASFVTNDTGTTGSDIWTVNVTVPCAGGCTLTPGYWKTHSEYGPAPYDDTWAMLPAGADTAFFGTGYTYYEMLHMLPTGGNAYVILAHAYIAAELNGLNGASMPAAVMDAMAQAEGLLIAYESEVSIPKKPKADRALAIDLATILDNYNNGLIGPGHCSE